MKSDMARKTWKLKEIKQTIDAGTAAHFMLSNLLRKCLEARGITAPEQIEAALGSGTELRDPFLFRDMQAAVDRIRQAIASGEKITVFGDYDADGVTSSYLLHTELAKQGADCALYIPERDGEGYGMNQDAVDNIAADGTKLIITVDCGVTAIEDIRRAYEHGMQVIVTDHHEPKEALPVCEALLDPKCAGSGYPFDGLAGVGVAFKLICALRGDAESAAEDYGDVVALGTVADVVPLTDENRRIVFDGLDRILYTKNKGLAALNRASAFCDAAHSAEDVAFKLAPKINAAGRMRTAYDAVKLLQSRTVDEAESRAAYLSILNTERQTEEKRVTAEAEAMINPHRLAAAHALVLAGDTWKHGVVGISAAKLAETYGVPTVLFAPDGELLRGSARGIEGFDLFQALGRATEGLGHCGGHRMAGGVTISADAFDTFRRRFEAICKKEMVALHAATALSIDCEVQPSELTEKEIAALARLEPFGAGNERPLLLLRNARIEELIPIGAGKHLRMTISAENRRLQVLAFRCQRERFRFNRGDFADLVVTASVESYRGASTVKLILSDIQPCENRRSQEEQAQQLFETVAAGEPAAEASFPGRQVLGQIWRRIVSLIPGGAMITPAQIGAGVPTANAFDVLAAIAAFEEAGLIECVHFGEAGYDEEMAVRICAEPNQKADLHATKIYAALCRQR